MNFESSTVVPDLLVNAFKLPPRGTDLTGPKLGLAAVMFLYVALACSLPLVIFNCMQRRSQRRVSTDSENATSDEDPEHGSAAERPRNKRSWCARCTSWSPNAREKFVGRANCLAAGALLSVGLLDVFMDTLESFESALDKLEVKSKFPIASFTSLLGFLLILGVEQLTLEYFRRPPVQNPHGEERNISGATISRPSSERRSIRDRVHSLTAASEAVTVVPQTLDPSADEVDGVAKSAGDGHDHSHFNTSSLITVGWIRVMILLFAISLHSVFEGMAIGLCNTLTSLLTLFGAVSLHKLIIAISIGINLASETGLQYGSGPQRRKLLISQSLAVLAFAGASPLGALVGWAVTSQTETVGFLLSQAILQGLACGTFFYVVFCELLPKEMHEEKKDKVGKIFFLVLGFALVAIVIAFGPQED